MTIPQVVSAIKDRSILKGIFGSTPILIGYIPVDVLISETPSYDFDTTDHPVEAGFDITDARNARPVLLSLECIFTDAEMDLASLASGAINAISGGTFGKALSFDTWQDKYSALKELKDSNQLLDISTDLDFYDSMVLTGVRIDRDKSTSQALFCRIDLKRIKIVSTLTGFVDDSAVPKELKDKKTDANKESQDKQSSPEDKGKNQTSEASSQDRSWLHSITQ